MLDQQHGDVELIADAADGLGQLSGFRGVHTGGRLIQQQQLGAGGQRAHDLQTALCAIGQAAGLRIGHICHVEDIQQLKGTLGAVLFLFPVVGQADQRRGKIVLHGLMQADLDVVDDAHLLEQTDVLEGAGHAHPVDLIGLFARRGHSIDQDGAAGGLVNIGQQVEHRGLTGTVGADQAGDLVAADHQVEAIHGGQAAKIDAQLTDIQNGLFVLIAVRQEAAGGDTVQSGLELTHGLHPPSFSCQTGHAPQGGSWRNRSCPAVRPGGRSSSGSAPASR